MKKFISLRSVRKNQMNKKAIIFLTLAIAMVIGLPTLASAILLLPNASGSFTFPDTFHSGNNDFTYTLQGDNYSENFTGHGFYDEYTGVLHVDATAYSVFSNPGKTTTIIQGIFLFDLGFDPYLSYDILINNATSSNETFLFSFVSPILTVNGQNTVQALFTASIPTSGTTFVANQYAYLGTGISNPMGVDLNLNAANTVTGGPIPGPLGSWDHLRIDLSGNISANGGLELTGKAEIDPVPQSAVPEPATMLLLGSGLVGLLGLRKKLKR